MGKMKLKRFLAMFSATLVFTATVNPVLAADNAQGGKVSKDNSRAAVIMDYGSTYGSAPYSGGFYRIQSYGKSYSDVRNDVITTTNYLIVDGYQQDSKTKTEYNVSTSQTGKTSCVISNYGSAYTYSTHFFKLKGYKDHVLNTSRSL